MDAFPRLSARTEAASAICCISEGWSAPPRPRKLTFVSEALEQLRANVAATPPAPPVLDGYLQKVRERAYTVTDSDVEALKAAGLSEDEIFEQTVAAAIGQGLRRLETAMDVIG
jgi:alkylhydroperoxidase family enzyme